MKECIPQDTTRAWEHVIQAGHSQDAIMAVDFPASSLNMITDPQFCAARALLNWTIADLAEASRLSESAFLCANRADDMPFMKSNNLFELERAVETAAVIVIDSDAASAAWARFAQP
jgi:hypothetical protein